MTSEEPRMEDISTNIEPNATEPPPSEPPSPEEGVNRSVPKGVVHRISIRAEFKQKGGMKKFRPINHMIPLIDEITGLGETALVKFRVANDEEPLLKVTKEMSKNSTYKDYFKVQLQENRAFRDISVIFDIISSKTFDDIRFGISEYLNAENVVMHKHVFKSLKVHHCGYIAGLDPGKTDLDMASDFVRHLTSANNAQVVKGPLFYKDEDSKWTKADLLSILCEPQEAKAISKAMKKERSHRDRGLMYLDCEALVYNKTTSRDVAEHVDTHKDSIRQQSTIVIDDAKEAWDDEILGDLMELETIVFINQSRANKDSLIVVTTKDKKDKTEKDILNKLKMHERDNELGRPYLRYNDPEAAKIKREEKPTKKPLTRTTPKPEVEFDEDDLEYIRMMQEVAETRRQAKAVAKEKHSDSLKKLAAAKKQKDEKTVNQDIDEQTNPNTNDETGDGETEKQTSIPTEQRNNLTKEEKDHRARNLWKLQKKQARMRQARLPTAAKKSIAPTWGGGGDPSPDSTPKRSNVSSRNTAQVATKTQGETGEIPETPLVKPTPTVENWEDRETFDDLPISAQKPLQLNVRMENENPDQADNLAPFVGKPDSPGTTHEQLKQASKQTKQDESEMQVDDKVARKRNASLSPYALEKQVPRARTNDPVGKRVEIEETARPSRFTRSKSGIQQNSPSATSGTSLLEEAGSLLRGGGI